MSSSVGSQSAISVQQLAEWRQTGTPHTVLDVREDDELLVCRIENAVHIAMANIPARLADLPLDVPVVVLCHHGMRSMQVVKFLHAAGRLNAVNLTGGIDAWASDIDSDLRRY